MGSVLGLSSQAALECRMGALLGGLPVAVPVHVVNRQCGSGLQAVAEVSSSIRAGYYSIGIAGGVESMSAHPLPKAMHEGPLSRQVASNQAAQDCLLTMGMTSENVAEVYGVSRQEQDDFAARSHTLAAAAQAAGKFDEEIVPVHTTLRDPATGEAHSVLVGQDDGIRAGTTPATLARLRPVFKEGGSTTAGNSSQVTDGAAALMLMTQGEAARRGLPILGTFRSFAAVGVPPAVLGIGPAVAIPRALQAAGLRLEDIDVYEINEAFASQAVYCVRALGVPLRKVNPNGGAIALGHPLGCTGARQAGTLLYELKRCGPCARYGVVSMCIRSGMGAAAVLERGSD